MTVQTLFHLLLLLLLLPSSTSSSSSSWSSYFTSLISFGTTNTDTANNKHLQNTNYKFKATLYFNGECCDKGHVAYFEKGSNLYDIRKKASTLFDTQLTISSNSNSNNLKLYDEIGLISNMERIVGNIDDTGELNKFIPPIILWIVPSNALFVWPTYKVGHIQRPKGVVSANPKKPLELETLSLSPRVFFVRNFLSDLEINTLITFAKDKLQRSHVGIGNEVFSDDRTSKTAWDTSSTNSMTIQRRAFDLVRIPYAQNQADAVQIIRYFEGQTYVGHTDYFDAGYDNIDPSTNNGTNRFMTIFAYLSDVEEGGHTVFPKSRTHPEHMTAKNQKQQKPPQQSKQNEGKAGEVETEPEVEVEVEIDENGNEIEYYLMKKTRFDENPKKKTCLWRSTKKCDPHGELDPTNNMECDQRVVGGKSGYCDCGDGRQVMRVTCEHSAFLCSNACNGRVSDGTTQTGTTFDTFVKECDSGDGLVVAPKRGDALLFYSQSPTGQLDPMSYHGGCPVIQGEKWASNVWIWNRKRPVFDSADKKQVDGNDLKLIFLNTKTYTIEVYWKSYDGPLKYFDVILPGQSYSVDTYTGHVWVIKNKESGEEMETHTAAKGMKSAVSV